MSGSIEELRASLDAKEAERVTKTPLEMLREDGLEESHATNLLNRLAEPDLIEMSEIDALARINQPDPRLPEVTTVASDVIGILLASADMSAARIEVAARSDDLEAITAHRMILKGQAPPLGLLESLSTKGLISPSTLDACVLRKRQTWAEVNLGRPATMRDIGLARGAK